MNGIRIATVIINNNVRACSKADCEEVVAHILPVGSTLTVYYPGRKKTRRGSQA
ncbi:DddA-like double-stranded DNA deaminase toxin [[Kitasatospora] papulosa]